MYGFKIHNFVSFILQNTDEMLVSWLSDRMCDNTSSNIFYITFMGQLELKSFFRHIHKVSIKNDDRYDAHFADWVIHSALLCFGSFPQKTGNIV